MYVVFVSNFYYGPYKASLKWCAFTSLRTVVDRRWDPRELAAEKLAPGKLVAELVAELLAKLVAEEALDSRATFEPAEPRTLSEY